MVVGDDGSFLKKYKLGMREIFRIYSSYLIASALQNLQRPSSLFEIYSQINYALQSSSKLPYIEAYLGHVQPPSMVLWLNEHPCIYM